MDFRDRALIDGPARITREGHLVASARVAKANNVQDYMPSEIGQPAKADGTPYRIFRPESAVFAKDAIASAAHRPITIDHPAEDVTAQNWKQLAVGDTGGEIMRDGDFLRIPVMVMDARGVAAAQRTHQEFSLGYSADLDMTPGKFGDTEFDGSMANIRVNHLALCGTARGGAELRIVDERPAHLRDQQETPMKIKIGDAEVDLSDGVAVGLAVGNINSRLADAERVTGTLTAENATLKTTIEARDGAITALEAQLADANDPAKVAARDQARTALIADAKKIGGAALVVDGKTDAEIRKLAVATRVKAEKLATMSDAAIEGAFTALVDAAPASTNPLDSAISGMPASFADSRTTYGDIRARQRAELQNAWRTPTKTEAA